MPTLMHMDERPGVWVLSAVGELDYGDCEAFRSHIERILSGMPPVCIVDMSRLQYLDSSGLGLLLHLYRQYSAAGGRLVLIASPMVEGVLQISRLAEPLTTAADLDTALGFANVGGPAAD